MGIMRNSDLAASDARIPAAFGTRRPADKNAIPVVGSLQTASARSTCSATTSRNPALAVGASSRESEQWRRSQSTKMTRAPPCAISAAIAAATLDLPSFGKHEVTPIVLVFFALLFRSMMSFIDRTASAYGDDGDSRIVHMVFGLEQTLLGATG